MEQPTAEHAIRQALKTDIGRQAWAAFKEEGKFLMPPFGRVVDGRVIYHRYSVVKQLKSRPEVE